MSIDKRIANASVASATLRGGFTIVELLIALALSAVILLGVYSMTTSVVNTKESLATEYERIYLTESLRALISRDISMMSSKKVVGQEFTLSEDREVIDIYSHNSLTFNKSIPVNISYYVEDGVLYREEYLSEMNYSMLLPLVENVEEWDIKTHNGRDYNDDFDPAGYIFKFNFIINAETIEFIVGRPTNATF